LGWVFGTGVFLAAAALTQFGSLLLLKAKNLSRHSNYSTIFYEIWKSKFAKGIGSIIIFLNNIGICKKTSTQASPSSSFSRSPSTKYWGMSWVLNTRSCSSSTRVPSSSCWSWPCWNCR
jgi:hypothetical protein